MKKKLLGLVLALCMLVAVMPTAFALSAKTIYVNADAELEEAADGTESKPFSTIKEALDAAQAGDTIELHSDLTVSLDDVVDNYAAILIEKNITIDGKNHTITATGSVKPETDADTKRHIMLVASGADVTIKNLVLDGAGYAKHGIQIFTAPAGRSTQTKAVLDHLTSKNNMGYGVVVNASALEATELVTEGNGWGGVNVDAKSSTASFSMISGTIGEGESIIMESAESGETSATISGGTFQKVGVHETNAAGTGNITISGGDFASVTAAEGDTVKISGGSFQEEIPEEYCDEGFALAKDEHGNYTVATTSGTVDRAEVVDGVDGYTYVTSPVAGQKLLANIYLDDDNIIGGYPVDENAGYRWHYADSDNVLGTEPYYTVTTEDVGKTLAVTVRMYGYNGTATWTSSDPVAYAPVTGITLDPTEVSLKPEETVELQVTVAPEEADPQSVEWSTEDPEVATVENGTITAVGEGSTTITAKAGEIEATCVVTVTAEKEDAPYTDLDEGAWYLGAVDYVTQQNIMQGIGDNLFAPDMELTRAQFAQILYNMEGQPATFETNVEFPDVPENVWYYDAIMWATDNGIIVGNENGIFRPDDALTRQEMVVMFHRYAEFKQELNDEITEDLSAFADKDSEAIWDAEAFAWAVQYGIVNGMDNNMLEAGGTATRAQAAKIVMVYGGLI